MQKMTVEAKIKRLFSTYPDMYKSGELLAGKLKEVYSLVPEPSKFMLVSHKEDIFRYIFTSIVLKLSKYTDIKVMSAFSLLDITFDRDDDYRSILEIDNRIVCLYFGYSELDNKLQPSVIEQLLDHAVMQGMSVWIIYLGNDFKSKYPKLYSKLELLKAEITDIDSKNISTSLKSKTRSSGIAEDLI